MLYQIICLAGTPPLTTEEQRLCMHAVEGCWRTSETRRGRNGRNGHEASRGKPQGTLEPS